MPRIVVLILILGAALTAGLGTVNGQVLALTVPLLVFLGAAVHWMPRELDLEVNRELDSDRVGPDSRVKVCLRLRDRSNTLEEARVAQPLPEGLRLLDGEKDCRIALRSDRPVEVWGELLGPRGYYVLPPIEIEAHDPFGLLRQTAAYDVANRLFVLPESMKIPTVAIKARRTRVYPGLIPARKGGPGVEFYGLREYRTGDSWRWINHRVSARHEEDLFVNEFELERAIDIGLILDVRAMTNLFARHQSILEFSVQATATLADALLVYGNRVGLFLYGGSIDWTFPGSGKLQQERIMRALARAQLETSQIFNRLDHVPARLFPPRSLLIVISPLHPQDGPELLKLRARGYQVTVVSPDPIAFERNLLEDEDQLELAMRIARLERNHLLAQMIRGGIRVCNWNTDVPFAEMAPRIFGHPRGIAAQVQ